MMNNDMAYVDVCANGVSQMRQDADFTKDARNELMTNFERTGLGNADSVPGASDRLIKGAQNTAMIIEAGTLPTQALGQKADATASVTPVHPGQRTQWKNAPRFTPN